MPPTAQPTVAAGDRLSQPCLLSPLRCGRSSLLGTQMRAVLFLSRVQGGPRVLENTEHMKTSPGTSNSKMHLRTTQGALPERPRQMLTQFVVSCRTCFPVDVPRCQGLHQS